MKEGLLDIADTTDAGYQLYEHGMIDRVREIRRLQDERYTLRKIRVKMASEK